eukprot:3948243-Amphidinium_carterae.3
MSPPRGVLLQQLHLKAAPVPTWDASPQGCTTSAVASLSSASPNVGCLPPGAAPVPTRDVSSPRGVHFQQLRLKAAPVPKVVFPSRMLQSDPKLDLHPRFEELLKPKWLNCASDRRRSGSQRLGTAKWHLHSDMCVISAATFKHDLQLFQLHWGQAECPKSALRATV